MARNMSIIIWQKARGLAGIGWVSRRVAIKFRLRSKASKHRWRWAAGLPSVCGGLCGNQIPYDDR